MLEMSRFSSSFEQGCESGSGGNGSFSAEAEARKFYRFCFHINYLN